jgi:hypothetical protein
MSIQKPKVFISSSSECLSYAEEIESRLVDSGVNVMIWKHHDIFTIGSYTLESLYNVLDLYDFAVVILSPDDKVISRGKQTAAPRDNVLMELGLFIGRFGAKRTIILHEESVKLPSNLVGITLLKYKDSIRETALCSKIVKHINKIGYRYSSKSYSKIGESEEDVDDCIKKATEIKMVGVCLASLNPSTFDLLNKKALSGTKVTICLADPESDSVTKFRDRFIYRQLGTGPCPTAESLKSFCSNINKKIIFKLFDYPPTFSAYIFDDYIFIYPYGCKILGTESPMFRLKKDGTNRTDFFINSANNIIDDSIDIDIESIGKTSS